MTWNIVAVYEGGVLKPKQPLVLTEGTEVRLSVTPVDKDDDPLGAVIGIGDGAPEPPPAGQEAGGNAHRPIWEVADELRRSIPAEEWAKLPVDGAAQHDHYIYGTPKRPAP
jgi:predicted DNA-binding antitoxin AbrB/MazE fold protein